MSKGIWVAVIGMVLVALGGTALYFSSAPTTDEQPLSLEGVGGVIEELIATVPETERFPTLEEGAAWLRDFEQRTGISSKLVQKSEQQRDIRALVFNQEAPKTALFLAYVHPNEPAGFPTLQFLAETLATPDNLISQAFPNIRFVFILAMEPDGVARNQGAYADLTLENYLLHYFRPSLSETAVYSLPYAYGPHYEADPSESADALMKIMSLHQPFFINELHGAEHDTLLYWTYEKGERQECGDRIEALVKQLYPDAPEEFTRNQMKTVAEKDKLPVGGATVDYARLFFPNAEVFNLELGLWSNPLLADNSPSDVTAAEVNDFYRKVAEKGLALLDRDWDEIVIDAQSKLWQADVHAYYTAFLERLTMNSFRETELVGLQDPLSKRDLFKAGGKSLLLLRNYALLYNMMLTLDRVGQVSDLDYQALQAEWRTFLVESLRESQERFAPGDQPVPISTLVKILAGSSLYALQSALLVE